MSELKLSPEQVRVLGVLVEKSITTPNYYPMTVNAVTNACNQKNSRVPVMQLSEVDVQRALADLQEAGFVERDDSSSRASKWSQQMRSQLLLKSTTQAVLVALMLRGSQTTAELLRNAQSLRGPTSAEALDAALEDLEDRAYPLVQLLARAPGQKEARWVHLCAGEPDPAQVAVAAAPVSAARSDRVAELEARIEALEQRIKTLEDLMT